MYHSLNYNNQNDISHRNNILFRDRISVSSRIDHMSLPSDYNKPNSMYSRNIRLLPNDDDSRNIISLPNNDNIYNNVQAGMGFPDLVYGPGSFYSEKEIENLKKEIDDLKKKIDDLKKTTDESREKLKENLIVKIELCNTRINYQNQEIYKKASLEYLKNFIKKSTFTSLKKSGEKNRNRIILSYIFSFFFVFIIWFVNFIPEEEKKKMMNRTFFIFFNFLEKHIFIKLLNIKHINEHFLIFIIFLFSFFLLDKNIFCLCNFLSFCFYYFYVLKHNLYTFQMIVYYMIIFLNVFFIIYLIFSKFRVKS